MIPRGGWQKQQEKSMGHRISNTQRTHPGIMSVSPQVHFIHTTLLLPFAISCELLRHKPSKTSRLQKCLIILSIHSTIQHPEARKLLNFTTSVSLVEPLIAHNKYMRTVGTKIPNVSTSFGSIAGKILFYWTFSKFLSHWLKKYPNQLGQQTSGHYFPSKQEAPLWCSLSLGHCIHLKPNKQCSKIKL